MLHIMTNIYKKYNINKTELAKYAGYSRDGVYSAMQTRPKLLRSAVLTMLLERKGFTLERIEKFVDILYEKDNK